MFYSNEKTRLLYSPCKMTACEFTRTRAGGFAVHGIPIFLNETSALLGSLRRKNEPQNIGADQGQFICHLDRSGIQKSDAAAGPEI